jgi:hypothetical protein
MTTRLTSPITLITAALFALTGCGGGNPIKANDRASITTVSVAPTVTVAGEPAVIGSEAGLAILFGAAGGAAVGTAGSSSPKSFGEFMRASGIDIGQIVREQFTEQLKANAFFGPRLSQNGEYRFVLEVRMYWHK